MATYIGNHKGFECYGHRYGTYAVRDGEAPGKPAGPLYAYLEVDEDGDISGRIADHLYYEEMALCDLMDEAVAERASGRPGLASAELSRRDAQKAVA